MSTSCSFFGIEVPPLNLDVLHVGHRHALRAAPVFFFSVSLLIYPGARSDMIGICTFRTSYEAIILQERFDTAYIHKAPAISANNSVMLCLTPAAVAASILRYKMRTRQVVNFDQQASTTR